MARLESGTDGERVHSRGCDLRSVSFACLERSACANATILENNIVQTAGSAGESIAFGVGVTMPAIMILGFDLEFTRVMLVAVLGGLLGILMMIPLRRALIVQQHGILKYPEGTACAEVLKAGASEESRAARIRFTKRGCRRRTKPTSGAKTIFTGFGIGLLYQVRWGSLKGWKDVPEQSLRRAVQSRISGGGDSRRRCWVLATSLARASLRSCARAACSPTWC